MAAAPRTATSSVRRPGGPTSEKVSTATTTSSACSAHRWLMCSSCRRSDSAQLIWRAESPGCSGRTMANSPPWPVIVATWSPICPASRSALGTRSTLGVAGYTVISDSGSRRSACSRPLAALTRRCSGPIGQRPQRPGRTIHCAPFASEVKCIWWGRPASGSTPLTRPAAGSTATRTVISSPSRARIGPHSQSMCSAVGGGCSCVASNAPTSGAATNRSVGRAKTNAARQASPAIATRRRCRSLGRHRGVTHSVFTAASGSAGSQPARALR